MNDAAPLPPFDRAGHLRKDLEALEAQLQLPETLLVPVWRGLTLVRQGRVALLRQPQARALLAAEGELVWLGQIGAAGCFAVDVSAVDDPLRHSAFAGAGEFQDLRQVGATLARPEAELAAYARGLLYWHTRHRHCGVCGSRTAAREGGHVRVCRNDTCAIQHFPRTDPAIIVLVQDGDRCLLGQHRRGPAGMYTTLAGFVEPGETIEQAVAREVEEEAGVRVTDIRYVRSQPWPFPASLMLGFFARALSADIRIAEDELSDARWFTREEVRNREQLGFFIPGAYSVAGQLIGAFVDQTMLEPLPLLTRP
jgi:NAD+ diphosphatase